jgi:hypothetical protein
MSKLAQVYLAKGWNDRAGEMKKEADQIYKALMATGEYAQGTIETMKWDYLICLKFR